MKYEELIILLPCHSLEDFPLHHEGEEAEGLLANWTAMWHPALLASAAAMPTWHRVDDPPEELANRLILVPSVSAQEMQTGFAQRAKGDGACLIRKQHDRNEIVARALESLDGGDAGVDAELVADFLALGYCYLQVELLTRQMRYASNLDEVYFSKQVVAAAHAAVEGDQATSREKLQACFDVLAEERDHYYPVDAFLLDITLVAPTTVGQSLRDELAAPNIINLLMSGESLSAMAADESRTLETLKAAIQEKRVGLIGGETAERRLPLLSHEAVLGDLKRGVALYEQHLGARPQVYGRRRFGLTPALPQMLHGLGFTGALHATLDDGRFPEGTQIKTRWEGSDGTAIDALARAPLDATRPETYLGLAVKMGESMDMDHVATVCLVHWPGQSSPWFEDLRRIARYSTALGKLITVDEYFRETDHPAHTDQFEAEQYRSPYLKQAVIRKHDDPLSTSVRYWRRKALADGVQALETLAALISGDATEPASSLIEEVDRTADDADQQALDERAAQAMSSAAERFANSLPHGDGPQERGYLVANPSSFVRRVGMEVSELAALPAVEKPVYAAAESAGRKHAVVDLPPMGFAWLSAAKSEVPVKKDALKTLAVEESDFFLLRNEFFEAIINTETGALQSIHEYKKRGNRMSQQLALRMPRQRGKPGDAWNAGDAQADYSVMAADEIQVTASSAVLGEVVTKGRLLDRSGESLAGFQQTYRLWRGSRVLQIEVELDPTAELKSDPWNSYYALRFAWANEAADVLRSAQQSCHPAEAKRIEAPHYLEIADEKTRTAILTGGLPYHQRTGLRMLDTLLIVRHERQRRFQVGIGIDLTHPMQEALGLLASPAALAQTAAVPAPTTSGWLFHLDNKNVVATYWQPRVEEGRVVGFGVRLLETSGRPSRVGMSTFRAVASAQRVDFAGNAQGELEIKDGKINTELAAHQWIEIEATF